MLLGGDVEKTSKLGMRRDTAKFRQRGAVSVETAIGMALFATIVFSSCEFALVFLKAATAQYVVAKEARDSVTFNRIRNSQASDVIARIRNRALSLGVDASAWDISICPASSPACTTSDLGSGGDLLVIQANPKLHMLANNLPLNFVASVLISRESST